MMTLLIEVRLTLNAVSPFDRYVISALVAPQGTEAPSITPIAIFPVRPKI